MPSGDNQLDLGTPFKGPFKGKGKNRKAVRELELELVEVKLEMEKLIERYNEAFPNTPRLVNLRILKRGSQKFPLIYWRETCGSGTFFKLFGNDKGKQILNSIGPRSKELFTSFDKEKLIVNFKSKMIGSVIEAYNIYSEGLVEIDEYFEKLDGLEIY
ncbi:MAG: hypothetical protein QM504_04235 [Pseudomonadota bacterium]